LPRRAGLQKTYKTNRPRSEAGWTTKPVKPRTGQASPTALQGGGALPTNCGSIIFFVQSYASIVNNEPIKAVYTYTRDEYLRALRRHYKSRLHLYRDVIFGGLLIAFGFVMMYFSPANPVFAWLSIILGLVLLLILAYAFLVLPALIYRADPKLKWEYSLDFYDDRIEFKTRGIDSTLQWSLYQSWLGDEEFFILYHGKRDLSVIPRRVLKLDNSDARFAKLLERKLGPPQTVSHFRKKE